MTKMNTLKTVLFAGLALFSLNTTAQTVDEIVGKYVEAMGGKERLDALKSVKMTGNMSTQGVDIAMTFTKVHQVGVRVDMEINGTSNYQMANATKGWAFMPVMGMTEPQEMDATQHKDMLRQMDLQGALYNYKQKGTTIDLAGKEMVDGSEAYKLNLKFSNGGTGTMYIDSKTNRLVKSTAKRIVGSEEMELETTYSNYKQDANGYWFPFTIGSANGDVNFDKIESNLTIDEAIFKN